jgi:hypothetical protein
MIIAVPVCIALIITAIVVIITRMGARAYAPGHSRRAPAAPAAVVPVPAPRPPAPPCSPADLTVLDLPPLLARRYVQAARQEERP